MRWRKEAIKEDYSITVAQTAAIRTMVSMVPTTTVDAEGRLSVPPEVYKQAHMTEGDQFAWELGEGGEITLHKLDPEQAWFWTPEWQAGEREAEEDLREGRSTIYLSDEEFAAAMDAKMKSP